MSEQQPPASACGSPRSARTMRANGGATAGRVRERGVLVGGAVGGALALSSWRSRRPALACPPAGLWTPPDCARVHGPRQGARRAAPARRAPPSGAGSTDRRLSADGPRVLDVAASPSAR